MKTVYRDSHVLLRVQKKPWPSWYFHVQPAATVLPVTSTGKILVMHEKKGGTGRWIWGFPGGMIEPGETPLEAGRRECEEELGLRPTKLKKFTAVWTDFPDTHVSYFLGFSLKKVSAKNWESETIGKIKTVSLAVLKQLAINGQIRDPRMVVAVLRLCELVRRKKIKLN